MANSDVGGALVERHTPTVTSSWLSPTTWVAPWNYTSAAALEQVERKLLDSIWHLLFEKFVKIRYGTQEIRTVGLNTNSSNTPLVMVHGMGAGVGLWILNLEAMARNRPVYALDILGFGRSSRPSFSSDPVLAEMEFVESLEEWRIEMNLDKFILLGHSLGGFLTSAYAISYPRRVRHLILVDPWGFPQQPAASGNKTPLWIKAIGKILSPFNPLAVLRVAGPWGPGIVARFRPDLTQKFRHLFDDDTVSQYVYHCNAQCPSGETAFRNMTVGIGWARFPMIRRIHDLPKHLPITVVYGSRSWVDSGIGWEIKYMRDESYVDVQVVKGAGHHVYADRAVQFNATVNRTCLLVDTERDLPLALQQQLYKVQQGVHAAAANSDGAFKKQGRRRVQSESLPDIQSLVEEEDGEEGSSSPKAKNLSRKAEKTALNLDTVHESQSSGESTPETMSRHSFQVGDDD